MYRIPFPQARNIAEHICNEIHQLVPYITTTNVSISQRGDKLFLNRTQKMKCFFYVVTWFAKCAEAFLTGSGSLGNGGKYFYYHCQHGCKERFRADEAHTLFQSFIGGFKVKPEIAALYLAVMEDIFVAEEGDRKKQLQKLDNEMAGYKEKLLKTEDLFIKGDLEKDSYKRMKDHYNREMWALHERKTKMVGMDTAFNQYMKWGFSLFLNFYEYYNSANHEVKQKMLGSIFPRKTGI